MDSNLIYKHIQLSFQATPHNSLPKENQQLDIVERIDDTNTESGAS